MKRLREARQIQTLSQFFLGDFTDISDEEDEKYRQEYLHTVPGLSRQLQDSAAFFFGHSHDSRIVKINFGKDFVEIILNDFSTVQLASALANLERIKLDKKELSFPVAIRFNVAEHFSANTVSRKGKIRRRKLEFLKHASEYLYEEFYIVNNDYVALALNIWFKRPRCEVNRWLVLIECETISVDFDLRKRWIDQFGLEKTNLFDGYWQERLSGKFFGDYSICQQFLLKNMHLTMPST